MSRYFNDIIDNVRKTQKIYEYILVDSKSIELVHTMDQNDDSRIFFAKCIVKNVQKSDDWTFPL